MSIQSIYNFIENTGEIDPTQIKNQLEKLNNYYDKLDPGFNKLDQGSNKQDLTPLHFAILIGDLELIKKFCNSNSINSKREFNLVAPLHYAIEAGNMNIFKRIEIIKFLVKNGANINIKNKMGESPLYLATREPSKQLLVPILLDLGAYPLETYPFAAKDIYLLDWIKKDSYEKNIRDLVKRKLEIFVDNIKNKLVN